MAHILYIEDEDVNARVVSRLLGRRGHRIEIIGTGEEALERLGCPPRPDLVLLDINLPGLNGFEVMAQLDDDVPVVAHTAEPDGVAVTVRDQALALGCVGYIPKPLASDFCGQVEAYLDGRRDDPPPLDVQVRALRAFGRATARRLEAEQAELRRLLREREQFAHAAIHELRTPLAQTALAAQVTEQGNDMWDALHEGIEALQRRVKDLLTFANLEGGAFDVQPEQLDLGAVVADYAADHRALCDDCTLHVDTVPGSVLVEADAGRLRQVLENLVGNAHKFVPEGRKPEIAIEVGQRDGYATLSVTDNGMGVPEDRRERIFAPFARLEAAEENAIPGLGLGLSVVKAIVDAHRGDVRVDEVPTGIGSRFVVRLPRNGHRQ